MAAVPIFLRRKESSEMTDSRSKVDWVNVAAGGALVVGGLLLLSEKKRVGMAVAATGTALALIGQEETVRAWWKQFPLVVDQVQTLVSEAQSKLSEFAARRDALHETFSGLNEESLLWKED